MQEVNYRQLRVCFQFKSIFGLIIKERVLRKICELVAFVTGRAQNDGIWVWKKSIVLDMLIRQVQVNQYGGTSELNLTHPNLGQIQVKHFVLRPPKIANIVTSNTKNGVVGLEFYMNIMFRITENENIHVKSGSPTKQHFVLLRRTTEVTTVYGEVKVFMPFLNTEGAVRRKIFSVVWAMKIKRTFFSRDITM